MRRTSSLFVAALLILPVAGCAGEREQPAEEAAPKEQPKEKAQGQSAFAGEHQNLEPGETAEWNAGMKITIEDAYIAPNERRRQAEERAAKLEAKAKEGKAVPEGKKEPALEEPERLIGFSWTITNDGQMTINFRGVLPCTALNENGIELSRARGSTAEQMARPPGENTLNILQQPLEPGQTRSGLESIPLPDTGVAELVCVHPPQQGGDPGIAQMPETAKATWILDPAELEQR